MERFRRSRWAGFGDHVGRNPHESGGQTWEELKNGWTVTLYLTEDGTLARDLPEGCLVLHDVVNGVATVRPDNWCDYYFMGSTRSELVRVDTFSLDGDRNMNHTHELIDMPMTSDSCRVYITWSALIRDDGSLATDAGTDGAQVPEGTIEDRR